MTRDEIATLLERHRDSFRRRDAATLALDHSPEGMFESPAHGVIRGRAAIEEIYRYWFTAFPDLLLTWDAPLVIDDRAALFWQFSGTVQGPFFGIAGAGTKVEMQGAADYRFDAEGIASVRHVFDFSSVLVKTGVLKVKPR